MTEGHLLSLTAGQYIRLSDLAIAAVPGEQPLPPKYVLKFFAQMLHGGTGLGYIFKGVPNGVTPAVTTDGGWIFIELAPATATAPGGTVSDEQKAFGGVLAGAVDITRVWVSGSHTGDVMSVGWDTAQ